MHKKFQISSSLQNYSRKIESRFFFFSTSKIKLDGIISLLQQCVAT